MGALALPSSGVKDLTNLAGGWSKGTAALDGLKSRMSDIAEKVRMADPKAKDAAEKFEAFYVKQFIDMTMPKPDSDNVFSGGIGEDMFRNELNQKMADGIAKQGGFGLADTVLKQMIAKQEAADRALLGTGMTTPAQGAAAYAASAKAPI